MKFFTVCSGLLSISIIKVVNQAVKDSVCNKYNDAGHPQRQKAKDFNVSQVAVAAAINCQSPRFIGGLITTIMKGLWPTKSALISANGNEGILNKLWDKANNAKSSIEEHEREVAKSRSQKDKSGLQSILYYLIATFSIRSKLGDVFSFCHIKFASSSK